MAFVVALVGWFGIASTRPAAESVPVGGQSADAEPLDRLLDLYVRDGLVYYAALRAERAILTLIEPMLFPGERAFLSANRFALRYQEFDWRLNDLTGGRLHD